MHARMYLYIFIYIWKMEVITCYRTTHAIHFVSLIHLNMSVPLSDKTIRNHVYFRKTLLPWLFITRLSRSNYMKEILVDKIELFIKRYHHFRPGTLFSLDLKCIKIIFISYRILRDMYINKYAERKIVQSEDHNTRSIV